MISAVVLTKNEEGMIQACLESIKWVDEIIVFDNGSTDKTLEIVKNYTNKIFYYEGLDYAELRNRAFEKTQGDWVFYIDADERVLSSLKTEVLREIESDKFGAYAIVRQNIIFGQKVNYGPYKNDRMIRLFRRNAFKSWVGKIHEHGEFEGSLGYLKNPMLHLTHRSVDQVINKNLHWSHFDAELRFKNHHPKMTGWRFLRILITETFYQGVVRKGFFNGTVGVIDSLLQVFSLLTSYIRLWEMQQSKPLKKVYEDLDKKLLENEFKI